MQEKALVQWGEAIKLEPDNKDIAERCDKAKQQQKKLQNKDQRAML